MLLFVYTRGVVAAAAAAGSVLPNPLLTAKPVQAPVRQYLLFLGGRIVHTQKATGQV